MVFISFGQTKTQGSSASPQVVNFSDTSKKDFDPALLPIDKQVIPSSEYGDKKEILHRQRMDQRNATSNPQKKKCKSQCSRKSASGVQLQVIMILPFPIAGKY